MWDSYVIYPRRGIAIEVRPTHALRFRWAPDTTWNLFKINMILINSFYVDPSKQII